MDERRQGGRRATDAITESRLDALEKANLEAASKMEDMKTEIRDNTAAIRALTSKLSGLPDHIAIMCRFARAASTLGRPLWWVVDNGRRVLIWIGGGFAAVYGIWIALRDWRG